MEVLLKLTVMKGLQLMKVKKNVGPASYILVPVVKIVKLYIILNWSKDSLHADFLENLVCCTRSGFLNKGSTAFFLFEELSMKLAKPNNFNYSETTLLRWLTYRNIFVER